MCAAMNIAEAVTTPPPQLQSVPPQHVRVMGYLQYNHDEQEENPTPVESPNSVEIVFEWQENMEGNVPVNRRLDFTDV